MRRMKTVPMASMTGTKTVLRVTSLDMSTVAAVCAVALAGFFFSSRGRHTRWTGDWSSDVCSSDLPARVASQCEQRRQHDAEGHRMVEGRGERDVAEQDR